MSVLTSVPKFSEIGKSWHVAVSQKHDKLNFLIIFKKENKREAGRAMSVYSC